jgi:type I restriction enzyme R subunit
MSDNEADTCRKFIVPKLQTAGWEMEPHEIAEQRYITPGRIVPVGKKYVRQSGKRVDYILRYRRDFPIAVVEAKARYRTAEAGAQQAKEYAERLKMKFAYASNGREIIEIDFTTGVERPVDGFPTPEALWARYRTFCGIEDETLAEQVLTPFLAFVAKGPRYYQEVAINLAVQVIVTGKPRALLTLATGAGKSLIAFQICWKLTQARWNRRGSRERPRILYLADRNVLVDKPKNDEFLPFGQARWKIEGGQANLSREMYFAIYQALCGDANRPALYEKFPPDFFDLVIVDECHRGSAKKSSHWREILNYFSPAVKLGMTATPKRQDNIDTYEYFGNPIYSYPLAQGIDDGFLAPYCLHRVVTSYDATATLVY